MKKNSLSPRVCRIRKNVVRRGGSFVSDYNEFCPELALFNAYTPGISRTQHRAAFLLELVKCFDIKIYKDWTLAGEHLAPLGGSPVSLQKVKNHLKKMKALGLDRKKVKEIEDAVLALTKNAKGDLGSVSACILTCVFTQGVHFGMKRARELDAKS